VEPLPTFPRSTVESTENECQESNWTEEILTQGSAEAEEAKEQLENQVNHIVHVGPRFLPHSRELKLSQTI